MLIPSYDFSSFSIPHFSELYMNDLGIDSHFTASMPSDYVNNSLATINDLLNYNSPYTYSPIIPTVNPSPYDLTQGPVSVDRIRALRDQADELLRRAGDTSQATPQQQPSTNTQQGKQCPQGYEPVSVFGIFSYCGKQLHSNDESVGTVTPFGKRISLIDLQNLPTGAGTFVIGIIILILLILFIRK